MYVVGRYTGWWLLGILCRLSISPGIVHSAVGRTLFYKRGRAVLVIAKFVPGITALASPLAGSMKMPVTQFLAFDLDGRFPLHAGLRGRGVSGSATFSAPSQGDTRSSAGTLEWSVGVLFAIYLGYRVLIVLAGAKARTGSQGQRG